MSAWLGRIAATVPLLYLSYVLFSVWYEPMAWDDGNWVTLGLGLMLLEFVTLHSGVFIVVGMRSREALNRRWFFVLGITAFYALLVLGFAMGVGQPQLLWIFALVMLGRLVSLAFDDNPDAVAAEMIARSTIGTVLYLLVVFGTIFVPIPELGITREVLDDVYPQRGSGVWEAEPHRAIAGAAVYFALLGFAEWRWINHPTKPVRLIGTV